MIIQTGFQFIPQISAILAMRLYRKEFQRPYGMRLYPFTAIVVLIG
jgi:hypothetical protein